jgi:hypothetical protein
MSWRRAFLFTVIFLSACTLAYSKSKLVMSWKNPSYSGERFQRILIIGMSDDPVVRLDFEDALAEKLTRDGLEAVPGNSILFRPDSPHLDPDYLQAQIRDHKIDAVITSRMIKFDRKTTYIPGHNFSVPYPYYNHFYGYYGAVYHQVYTPDYLREDTTVSLETTLYSATPPDEDLVWIAYSNNFNPKDANRVIKDEVKLIVQELEKEAILRKNPK